MQKLPWLLGGLLLLGLVIAYTQELPVMMNYLNVGAFWRTGLLLGLGVSVLVLALLFYRFDLRARPVVERLQLGGAVLFLGLLLCPLLLSYSNRLGVTAARAEPTPVVFESEQARYGSRFGNPKGGTQRPNQYLLFFFRDGRLYRVNGRRPFFPDAREGDTITLNIVRGRWGYEWVVR